MKHYILVKLKDGSAREALAEPVRELFTETLVIPGIHSVRVKTCAVDRPNRYDLMIVIGMDAEALPAYDASEPHRRWKADYGHLIAAKAIFDADM